MRRFASQVVVVALFLSAEGDPVAVVLPLLRAGELPGELSDQEEKAEEEGWRGEKEAKRSILSVWPPERNILAPSPPSLA